MPRSLTGLRYEPSLPVRIALILGPADDDPVSDQQLEAAWQLERDQLMASCRRNPNPAWRCWSWWKFEAGEDPPTNEVEEARRLAAMGELRPDEIADLERRASGSERWARVLGAVEANG